VTTKATHGPQPADEATAPTPPPTPLPQALPQVQAPQPAAPVDAPAPAASTAPPPAAQLATHLAPLYKGPDGIHRLTIHLNPVDLGPISVTAEVRGGDIAVQLAGATDAGREALRGALPDLRKHLEDAGFGSCALDLQRDAPNPGHDHQQRPAAPEPQARGGNEPERPAGPAPVDPPARTTAAGTAHRSLDLHV
jgi:flagellar hook-length control protein FliK